VNQRARDFLFTATLFGVLSLTRSSLADHYHVPSGSMQPTVEPGDHIFVQKFAYGLRLPGASDYLLRSSPPQPGDVIVLDSPEGEHVLLKRVVAGPGEVIEVRAGLLLREGVPVKLRLERGQFLELLGHHEHAIRLDSGGGPDFGPVRVPADRFLVMGDHRGNSHDGRAFGFVERGRILGRAVGLYRPRQGFAPL
jgi:signal peptidase I